MQASYKFLFAFVLVGVIGVAGWFAFTSQSGSGLADLSANTKLSDEQVGQLIERVSRFLVLPSDEQPSVIVIKDAEQLAQQQSFYKGARDGDVLILYSSRAIIYDADANKLVNVGPIVRNDALPPEDQVASGSASATPTPAGTPAAPEKVTVDVRNGTGTAGLAGATASDLKKNAWVAIGKVGDAKGSYTETVIVDLSKGTKPNAVAQLEKLLGAKAVTVLPTGETSSTADILVIVGK